MFSMIFASACTARMDIPTEFPTPPPPPASTQKNVIRCADADVGEPKAICDATGFDPSNTSPNFPFEITFAKIDLNLDENDEYVVWESSWAGTSGGMLWALEHRNGRYRKVFETEMTWTPVILLKSKSHGWRDFAYLVTGGGVEPVFVTVSHNGKSYKDGKHSQSEQPEGEILIGKNWSQSYFGPIANQ